MNQINVEAEEAVLDNNEKSETNATSDIQEYHSKHETDEWILKD